MENGKKKVSLRNKILLLWYSSKDYQGLQEIFCALYPSWIRNKICVGLDATRFHDQILYNDLNDCIFQMSPPPPREEYIISVKDVVIFLRNAESWSRVADFQVPGLQYILQFYKIRGGGSQCIDNASTRCPNQCTDCMLLH